MPKTYIKGTEVLDEILFGAERYNITENNGAAFKSNMRIELSTPVTQAGTIIDATRINNMENGIDLIDTKLADATDLLITGGTNTAYTISTIGNTPLTTGESFRIKIHATAGSNPTLNRDDKGVIPLKFYDSSGVKQNCTSAQIIENMILDVIYDGVDYVVLNPSGISGGVGTEHFILPFMVKSTSSISGSVNLAVAGLPAYPIYLTNWTMIIQTGATSNEANYYWAKLLDVKTFSVEHGHLDTQGLAPNTIHKINFKTLNTTIPITQADDFSLMMSFSRVGTASTIVFLGSCVEYRLSPP